MKRAKGAYARLDVKCWNKKRIVLAGNDAELLYYRAMQYCKDLMNDGEILAAVLPMLCRGMSDNPERYADRLVKEELWVRTDAGWRFPFDKWDEWQTTKQDVEEIKATKAAAGLKGAKKRWAGHKKAEDGKADSKCHSRTMARTESREQRAEDLFEQGKPCSTAEADKPPSTASAEALLIFTVNGSPKEWKLTQGLADKLKELYPTVDVMHEAKLAHGKIELGAVSRKTHRGMQKFLTDWMERASNGRTAYRHMAQSTNGHVAHGGVVPFKSIERPKTEMDRVISGELSLDDD